MLLDEFLELSEWSFLAKKMVRKGNDPTKVYVCVEEEVVEDGIVIRKKMNHDASYQLQAVVDGLVDAYVPSVFQGYQVLNLEDAFKALFRSHPHTGLPITETEDPFHHTRMSRLHFQLYLFGQGIGEVPQGVQPTKAIRPYLTTLEPTDKDGVPVDPDWKGIHRRFVRAGQANATNNPDTKVLLQALEREWWRAVTEEPSGPVVASGGVYDAATIDRVQLHEILKNHFSEEELITLCFTLGIDYENLPAQGKDNKARELIGRCERSGLYLQLCTVVRQNRPHVFR